MARLMRAFFYKISKDITFRITLIIGAGMAVLITLIYLLLQASMGDELGGTKILTGQSMLISSFSPLQNFGIAIPINLISYIYLEFSQGTIRNKIIAGHSKTKIYASLYLSGLVFAFALLLVYVGLCTGLGSIFGGFDANGFAMVGTSMGCKISTEFVLKFCLLAVLVYASLVSFTIFVITTFRNMGPSIPIVILILMGCYLLPTIVSALKVQMEATQQMYLQDPAMIEEARELDGLIKTLTNTCNVLKVVDPMYGIAAIESNAEGVAHIDNLTLFGGIGSNLFFAGLFFGLGTYEFMKRDIK